MSYLNDPRVLLAAERTLLAWQRTSIALVNAGVWLNVGLAAIGLTLAVYFVIAPA